VQTINLKKIENNNVPSMFVLPTGDQTGIEFFKHRKIKTITPGVKQVEEFEKMIDLSTESVMF